MSKILVIDDEQSILTLCKDVLSPAGHEVSLASDSKTGLALLEKEKPSLVILDLHLLGESGLSLLPKIKSMQPDVPVLIFSGVLNAEIESQAFRAGADDIISKGRSNQELITKAGNLLSQKFKKSSGSKRPEKILVVDDEGPIRQFLVSFLQNKGYATLEAKNGPEAIEIVRAEKPSLMLLDMMMPGMTGIEALREIRKFDKEIGVVMATASQDEDLANEAMELGTYQFVLKPFDLKYLEMVVLTRLLMA